MLLVPTLDIDPIHEGIASFKRVPTLFPTNGLRVDALAWSPNSRPVAAALGDDTVEVWDLETGDNIAIAFSQAGNANALAWSHNGALIAAVSGNNMVELRSATAGSRLLPRA